ncbi:MAG TPA: SDR family oxidoreductase [Streptosporangiaceae bacterium]|nr:SDR family oxidoreductase [Streptosporangiaceae bacterium]
MAPDSVTADNGSARVAVVTGGASGIGLASCARLRDEGFTVAALDMKPDGAADTAALTLRCDVTDEGDVASAMAVVASFFGGIDVLVNNAGITGSQQAARCHETPVDEWDRVQAVNVRGPFLCSRAVLPAMVARGSGHIITIASVAGLVAFPGRCAYTASKGAAVMLTRSIAVDYAAAGIRANAVCPGMVYTPMTSWRLDQPELRAEVESRIPVGRVASPDEIADAVALLASGRLAYMTGHPLVVDGGLSAM